VEKIKAENYYGEDQMQEIFMLKRNIKIVEKILVMQMLVI